MSWLLWREFRLNRQLLIAGGVLLMLPYLFTSIVFLWPTNKVDDPSDVLAGFAIAAIMSYVISQVTIALLSGNAFAGEKADRSAEFMAYLPVSRLRRLVGKLFLTAVVVALIWGINLLVLWSLRNLFPWQFEIPAGFFEVRYTALTGLAMFGVCWFASSIQSSPSFAVCGGLITPVITVMALQIAFWLGQWDRETFDSDWYNRLLANGYTSMSIVFGLAGFSLGTWYFLKRVEP